MVLAMSIFAWCSRRAGGLSMLVLVALCYWVIWQEAKVDSPGDEVQGDSSEYFEASPAPGGGIWTVIFAYYSLFIHVLVVIFPMRACWALWSVTKSLRKSEQNKAISQYKKRTVRRRVSLASVSSAVTVSSDALTAETNASSSTVGDAVDVELHEYTDDTDLSDDQVIHAIVIPNYKEEIDTLTETLDVLASHSQARCSYDVYLGMEQREPNAESKAAGLVQKFESKFRSIDFSLHPSDIPGESAGKGSNIGWAARTLSTNYALEDRHNVIVTGIDADSHLASSYFKNIHSMHHEYPETAGTTLYAAPIIFDRNAHLVPAIVRVADILWCAAGLSGLYPGSVISPPTSVYSLPLTLIDRVGGWDCDAEAIGEDLHMYIKCFFALNGNLTCRTVLSPVSQSNVTGGAGKGGIRGCVKDMQARYKQALRHMWGALDTGYAMRRTVEMWRDRKQTSRTFRPLHSSHGTGSKAHAPPMHLTDSPELAPQGGGLFSDLAQYTVEDPHWENIFYLSHRLFEAHFLPIHMTILVIASTLYVWVTDGNDENDPHSVGWTFTVAQILRTLGFMGVGFYFFLYEGFHRICVANREREMTRANLVDGMCFSYRSIRKNFIDYALAPVVAPVYGAIPCAQAELSHFWTVDLVYTVSKKVTRQRARSDATEVV